MQPTTYGKPCEVASFSYDGSRRLLLDRSQLKMFRPEADFGAYSDLTAGFETFIGRDEERNERLDAIIAAVPGIKSMALDVVTWRGIMTKLLCTPFLPSEKWSLWGMAVNGVIYLVEVKAESAREQMSPRHAKLCYSGLKFETLCMVPAEAAMGARKRVPNMLERAATVVNNNEEFDIVFTSQLGPHRLLLGAEIDGLDEDGLKYVELKTTKSLSNGYSRAMFKEVKLLKWWLQCFLAGVPDVVAGFRSDRMRIDEPLERIPIASIPRRVRGSVKWDPQLVLAFGELILSWLRQMIALRGGEGESALLGFALSYDPAERDATGSACISLDFDVPVPNFLPTGFT